MKPPAVTAGILMVDLFPRNRLHLAIDGVKLLVRQSHHHGKCILLGENMTNQFLVFPMGDAPAILIPIGECDRLSGSKSAGQPLVQPCVNSDPQAPQYAVICAMVGSSCLFNILSYIKIPPRNGSVYILFGQDSSQMSKAQCQQRSGLPTLCLGFRYDATPNQASNFSPFRPLVQAASRWSPSQGRQTILTHLMLPGKSAAPKSRWGFHCQKPIPTRSPSSTQRILHPTE